MQQHSELSHECDENEVMLQAGPLVRARVEEPEKAVNLDAI